jgi:WD40 repeat protein
VAILDADTGELLRAFAGDVESVVDAAWSPDGTNIVTAGASGTARIWDAATGELIRDLYPEAFVVSVFGVAWSPDGTRIATYANDAIGSVWNAATGEELLTFSGHTGEARLYWSHTGERILTTSMDGTVRVWDVSTALALSKAEGLNTGAKFGVELFRYPGISAAWSPDGRRIATADADGTLKVFPAWETTEELIEYARECCKIRELTAEERAMFGLSTR